MKFILNYFSSVKMAIILLIIITLASILGTLVPQLRTDAEYAIRYGRLAPLLIQLEVTDLYHSWWYMGGAGLSGHGWRASPQKSRP